MIAETGPQSLEQDDVPGATDWRAKHVAGPTEPETWLKGLAQSTRKTHERAWGHFAEWCRSLKVHPIPTSVGTLNHYLLILKEEGGSDGKSKQALRTISRRHRLEGHTDPVAIRRQSRIPIWKRDTNWTRGLSRVVVQPLKQSLAAFVDWEPEDALEFPITPRTIGRYIGYVMVSDERGDEVDTFLKAVSIVHRHKGEEDPTLEDYVQRVLDAYEPPGQGAEDGRMVRSLNRKQIQAIRESAGEPRMYRETIAQAWRRSRLDLAMVGLMYDCMMVSAEAARLRWDDIEYADGRPFTVYAEDSDGQRIVAGRLSAETADALTWLRGSAEDCDPVLGISTDEIERHIREAAEYAGLGSGFNGLSPRAGAAEVMAEAGARYSDILDASRGTVPVMHGQYMLAV